MTESTPQESTGPDITHVCHLGQGGMGSVCLARRRAARGFQRLVVVKRLHAHLAKEEGSVERLVNEAIVASHVHHANVVGIQDIGSDEQGYFLVLDYIEGGSLYELTRAATERSESLPRRAIYRILLDAIAGVHAVHQATDEHGVALGILHRDVTPHNLLIGRDGVTRVTDFGVAKDKFGKGQTAPGMFVGKLRYVAPEYLLQEPIDRRLDVYAMGVSAWFALSGHAPWAGCNDIDLATEILERGVPRLPEDVPTAIADVVAKACATSASDRYATAEELGNSLAAAALATKEGIAEPVELAALLDHFLAGPMELLRDNISSTTPAPRRSAPPDADCTRVVESLSIHVDVDLDATTTGEPTLTLPSTLRPPSTPTRARDSVTNDELEGLASDESTRRKKVGRSVALTVLLAASALLVTASVRVERSSMAATSASRAVRSSVYSVAHSPEHSASTTPAKAPNDAPVSTVAIRSVQVRPTSGHSTDGIVQRNPYR